MIVRRFYADILNIARLLLLLSLSFIIISGHEIKAQENDASVHPLAPTMKYPDLRDSRIGMQPVFDDHDQLENVQTLSPSAEPAVQEPIMPALPPAAVSKNKPPANNTGTPRHKEDPISESKTEHSPSPDYNAVHIISFIEGKSDLTSYEITRLEKDIIPFLHRNNDKIISLQSYASGGEENSISYAKRMALSRALVVREYLLSRNISSSRIDLNVHYADSKGKSADRIELLFQ